VSGNVLLGQLLGAEYIYYSHGEDEEGADQALRDHATSLQQKGFSPYVIPLGLHNPPLGALGYVLCAAELIKQLPRFDAVVVASGSGQTHAGLLMGLRLLGCDAPVFGICVRRDSNLQRARLHTVVDNLSTLLKVSPAAITDEIQVWDGALAPGYGQLNDQSRAAMRMAASLEGLFLDPVYTAKSFAGISGLLESGNISPGMRVVYIHTGGLPALFGYVESLN